MCQVSTPISAPRALYSVLHGTPESLSALLNMTAADTPEKDGADLLIARYYSTSKWL
jgi:hypothetical protein